LTFFTSLKFNKWGVKPGFILVNNVEIIQIYEEETNKDAMKNFKL